MHPRFLLALAVLTFTAAFVPAALAGEDNDPQVTGCRPPTAEEEAHYRTRATRIGKIRMNALASKRINEHRRAKGLPAHASADVAPMGEEIMGGAAPTGGTDATVTADQALVGALPVAVNNTELKYFPPVASQGSQGSCACFSTTYYQMTHMTGLARDFDNKADSSHRFSTAWTYNMINGGGDNGSYPTSAHCVGITNGCATLSEFPYSGVAGQCVNWCLDGNVWRNAINYRMDAMGTIGGVDTDAGMSQLKQLLVNGYVVTYATNIYGWQFKTIANNTAGTADDPYVGWKIASYCKANQGGGHAMTVAGYNDDIWCDVNGNGTVDAGELGALLIVNSWGSGWNNGGMCWLAYDALKSTSAVAGGPTDREDVFWYKQVYWITAKPSYTPQMVATFTVNHAKRNQMTMTVGKSATSTTTPSTTWMPTALNGCGGALAFDGTTTACDGTFCLDMTGLAPDRSVLTRYYLGMTDGNWGAETGTIKSFKVVDVAGGNVEKYATNVPQTANANTVYAYTDYSSGGQTIPAAPTNLVASAASATQINLTWSDNANNETGFKLERKTGAGGTWAQIATTSANVTSYSNTGLASNTTYVYRVRATNAVGDSAYSNEASATTGNQPPTVQLTAPANGATFTAPASITLTATASDPDGSVTIVEFYNGATKLGQAVASPYSFSWTNVPAGSYSLVAKATDNNGATATSASVNITVTRSGVIGNGDGLRGEYFGDKVLSTSLLSRIDPTVNFDWGTGSPATNVPADGFSVRWTGQIQAQYSETYTVYTQSDDGVRLWIGGNLIVDNWADHAPTEDSKTLTLVAGQKYDLKMEYYENGGGAVAKLLWSSPSTVKQFVPQSQLYSVIGSGDGLRGEYFGDKVLSTSLLTRIDPTVNFDWGTGSPATNVPADGFSVRWTGQIQAQYSETYTVYTQSDDGVRLWIGGNLIVDNWTVHPPTENSGTLALVAGQKYDLRMEYYENTGGAVAKLFWSSPSTAKQVIPQSQLYSVIGGGNGLRGEYFGDTVLSTSLLSRIDPTVNFDWGTGSPATNVPADGFSVRWTGQIEPQYSETYTVYTQSDDGVRLWIGGNLIVDNWTVHPPTENSGTLALVAGQKYDLRMEYYENTGGAVAKLFWSSPSTAKQVVPQSQLYAAPEVSATTTNAAPGAGVAWSSKNIGDVAKAGRFSQVDGNILVSGSGADIGGLSDEYHFVYRPMSGDGSITARVNSLENTDPWAKAGVMIRQNLDANSGHVSAFVTPGGTCMQRRNYSGDGSRPTGRDGKYMTPGWVRIVRTGNNFKCYKSCDGLNWKLIGQVNLTWSAGVYVGLAVTSHNDGKLSMARFDQVKVQP